MEGLRIVNTKYGKVAVTDQSKEVVVTAEDGTVFDRWPAGLVLRWIPAGRFDPDIRFVEGVFLKDFDRDGDVAAYINDNNLLD